MVRKSRSNPTLTARPAGAVRRGITGTRPRRLRRIPRSRWSSRSSRSSQGLTPAWCNRRHRGLSPGRRLGNRGGRFAPGRRRRGLAGGFPGRAAGRSVGRAHADRPLVTARVTEWRAPRGDYRLVWGRVRGRRGAATAGRRRRRGEHVRVCALGTRRTAWRGWNLATRKGRGRPRRQRGCAGDGGWRCRRIGRLETPARRRRR